MKISNAILGFLAVVCCILQTNAQSSSDTETKNYDQGFRLGFGVNGGYIFQEPYHFSYGGDVRLQYDLSKRYSITLTGGYTNFTISGSKNHLAFIPVRAGYKTFIWENKFYAMGEFGAAFGVTDAYRKTSAAICPTR